MAKEVFPTNETEARKLTPVQARERLRSNLLELWTASIRPLDREKAKRYPGLVRLGDPVSAVLVHRLADECIAILNVHGDPL